MYRIHTLFKSIDLQQYFMIGKRYQNKWLYNVLISNFTEFVKSLEVFVRSLTSTYFFYFSNTFLKGTQSLTFTNVT